MEFLTLDVGGIVLAVILGAMLLVLGMGLGYFFLSAMIVFLVLSAIVTWTGIKRKRRMGIGQSSRGIKNVLANGMPAIIMTVIFYFANTTGNEMMALAAAVGFLGSIAAITADKFNSEIGILDGVPHMIFTMRKVKKGTSGGITILGAVAGLAGAVMISFLIVPVAGQLGLLAGVNSISIPKSIAVITISGLIGSFIDSGLGYYEERGIGNKFTSNFACGIAAGMIAMLLLLVGL